MLQTILDQVTTMGENMQDIHQFNEGSVKEILKVKKIGKETNIANDIALCTSQDEVNQEEKPSYDDELGSDESSATSKSTKSNEKKVKIIGMVLKS